MKSFTLAFLLFSSAGFAADSVPFLCAKLVDLAHTAPEVYAGCEGGHCNKNIRRLLEAFLPATPNEFDWERAKVLVLLLADGGERGPISAQNWREKGTLDFYGHVVLRLGYEGGVIVDFDYGRGNEFTPVGKYFETMFGEDRDRIIVAEIPARDMMFFHPYSAVGQVLGKIAAAPWWNYVHSRGFVPLAEYLK